MRIKDKIKNYFDGVSEITPTEQRSYNLILKVIIRDRVYRDKLLLNNALKELQDEQKTNLP